MGPPVAIVTQNGRLCLRAVCHRLGMIPADLGVTREDVPPKPHPACLYSVAKSLKVPVECLLVVGGFRYDIEAGRAAGALTVLLTNGQKPSWTAEADLVVEHLLDLLSYLKPA